MIDLALTKQHLRVDHDEEDTLIGQYLAAAVAWVENYTGKLLTRREVTQEETGFGSYLALNYGPVPENLTIDFIGGDDVAGTIADARIVRDRAYPASAWPTAAFNTPVNATYTAGYTETPADLDSAVLLLVGDLYKTRETNDRDGAIQMAVEALCRPYRSLRI